MSRRIGVEEARALWLDASDEELWRARRRCATASTSRTAPPTW